MAERPVPLNEYSITFERRPPGSPRPDPREIGSPRTPKPPADCGPRALLALCRAAGKPASLAELTRLCQSDRHGTTLEHLVAAARTQGLQAEAAQVDAWYLRRHRPAGLAWVNGDHFVAFLPGRNAEVLRVEDPNLARPEEVPVEKLARRSQGMVMLVAWNQPLPPIGKGSASPGS